MIGNDNNSITVAQHYFKDEKTAVKCSVTIYPSIFISIHVHNKLVPLSHELYSHEYLLRRGDEKSLAMFFDQFRHFSVCSGSNDKNIVDLLPHVGAGLTLRNHSDIVATREEIFFSVMTQLLDT